MADLGTFMQTYLARGREERQAAREAQARKEYIESQARMFDERLEFDKMQTAVQNRRAEEAFAFQKEQTAGENTLRLIQGMAEGNIQPGSTEYTPPSPIPGLNLGGPSQKVTSPGAMQLFGQSVSPVSPEFRRHSASVDALGQAQALGQLQQQQRMDAYKQISDALVESFPDNPEMQQAARQMSAFALIGQPAPEIEEQLKSMFTGAAMANDAPRMQALYAPMRILAQLNAMGRTPMFSPSAGVSGDRLEASQLSKRMIARAAVRAAISATTPQEEKSRLLFSELKKMLEEGQANKTLHPDEEAAIGEALQTFVQTDSPTKTPPKGSNFVSR